MQPLLALTLRQRAFVLLQQLFYPFVRYLGEENNAALFYPLLLPTQLIKMGHLRP